MFGPAYGDFPAPTPPPLVYLAPGGECISIRVDQAVQGIRIVVSADELTGWGALFGTPGAQSTIELDSVGDGIVEGAVDGVTDEYIRLTATRPGCAESRIVTLRQFSDGKVAVVGYSAPDCQSSGGARSLSTFKTGIDYIDDAERMRLRDAVLGLRLARYSYTDDPLGARRLGIILDDASTLGVSLTADGTHVDVYAYASLAVATVQQQQRELAELRARLTALEAALKK